ncbi:MAG TPA: hypothetical protein VF796_16245, partial [Humisphaera sp.]
MLTPHRLAAVLGLSAALGLAAGCESNHASHAGTKATAKAGDDCCADACCATQPTTAPAGKSALTATTKPTAATLTIPAAPAAAEPAKPAAPA